MKSTELIATEDPEYCLAQHKTGFGFANTRIAFSEKESAQNSIFALHLEVLYRKIELAHRRIAALEEELCLHKNGVKI